MTRRKPTKSTLVMTGRKQIHSLLSRDVIIFIFSKLVNEFIEMYNGMCKIRSSRCCSYFKACLVTRANVKRVDVCVSIASLTDDSWFAGVVLTRMGQMASGECHAVELH